MFHDCVAATPAEFSAAAGAFGEAALPERSWNIDLGTRPADSAQPPSRYAPAPATTTTTQSPPAPDRPAQTSSRRSAVQSRLDGFTRGIVRNPDSAWQQLLLGMRRGNRSGIRREFRRPWRSIAAFGAAFESDKLPCLPLSDSAQVVPAPSARRSPQFSSSSTCSDSFADAFDSSTSSTSPARLSKLLHPSHLLCRRLRHRRSSILSVSLAGPEISFVPSGFHFTSQTRHLPDPAVGSAVARSLSIPPRPNRLLRCFRRAGRFRFVYRRKLHSQIPSSAR